MKKFIILAVIFFTLGAGYPAAKTKWNNWAKSSSSGVSLECPDKDHSIKFYHAHGKFSTLSVTEGRGPDSVAIYVRHSDGRPMLQVVEPGTKKVFQVDLIALAKRQANDEDRLPWGDKLKGQAGPPLVIAADVENEDSSE